MSLKERLAKARNEIITNPRKCEICGEVETIHNIMLSYDNGKIMCDDCSFEYYAKKGKGECE